MQAMCLIATPGDVTLYHRKEANDHFQYNKYTSFNIICILNLHLQTENSTRMQ